MAFEPSALFVILTGAILVLIGVVVVLEKVVTKKKELTVTSPAYLLTKELKDLKRENLEPSEMLGRIDAFAKKAIGQSAAGHMDYSQLAEANKEKHHVVEFCSQMTESLYAGEKVTAMQVKNLLNALEDMLKGEGKLILITPREEILEGKQSSFFLDRLVENAAQKVNARLQEMKRSKEEKEAAKQKAAAEAEAMKKAQEEQAAASEPKEEPMPEFKKQVFVNKKPSKKDSKQDRKEYKYIESVDVLDRIQNKLKQKKAVGI